MCPHVMHSAHSAYLACLLENIPTCALTSCILPTELTWSVYWKTFPHVPSRHAFCPKCLLGLFIGKHSHMCPHVMHSAHSAYLACLLENIPTCALTSCTLPTVLTWSVYWKTFPQPTITFSITPSTDCSLFVVTGCFL